MLELSWLAVSVGVARAVRRFRPPCAVAAYPGPLVASRVVGVGNGVARTAASCRPCPRPSVQLGGGLVVLFAFGDAVGVGSSPILASESSEWRTLPTLPAIPPRLLPYRLADGVGNDEDSPPDMRSANILRRQRNRKDFIAELPQAGADLIDPPLGTACDVLDDNPPGAGGLDDPGKLKPQSRALPSKARALARAGDIGAGKPSTDEVSGRESWEGSDVFIAGHSGPMSFEDGAAERVALHLVHHRTEAGHLEASFETAYAGEEAADREHVQSQYGSPHTLGSRPSARSMYSR